MSTTILSNTQQRSRPTISKSSLVSPWQDPKSGIVSYILTSRVAELQQSFYFVNPGMSADGRFCWFYFACPPGGSSRQGRMLGVCDFARGRIEHFPETQFLDASPLVDTDSAEVYWCSNLEVWKRGPGRDDKPRLVNRLPQELARSRQPVRVATHLTFSADKRSLNFDAEFGAEWLVGSIPLDGSQVELWQRFDRCYNHGQFSPTDPDVQMIAQDYAVHPITGNVTGYENRIWLIRREKKATPLFAQPIPYKGETTMTNEHLHGVSSRHPTDCRAMHGHEWWDADGRKVWYVHYGTGVERACVSSPIPELVWPLTHASHAHSDRTGSYLVADSQPPQLPSESRVAFLNRKTGHEVNIVSQMPRPTKSQRNYHVHPHPQFCASDRYLCYTTTVLGRVDVAFTPVETLIEATST